MSFVWRVLREPFTARAWRTFVYCLAQPVIVLFGFIVVSLVVVASVGTVGVLAVPLIPPTLAFGRWLGSMSRSMAGELLDVQVPEPARTRRKPGWLGMATYYFFEPVAWRSIAYLLVKLLLFVLELAVGVAFRIFLPFLVIGLIGSNGSSNPGLAVVIGAVLFFAAPYLTELVLKLDVALIKRLLGPSEESLRIRELEQTRTNAINEAAATLRRIERDLHDGAQARLVALGMRLGRAERQFERGNAEQGMALLRESRTETKEIIQDLRSLVRGIHPPALDSGLEPALTTLAAMTPISTTVRVALPRRLSAAAETILYFAATELLTNAAKHGQAENVAITVLTAEGGATRLIVTDDGRGGATLEGSGSGLRGLAERIRTMDGGLTVDSPRGGPTTVTVELPPENPPETPADARPDSDERPDRPDRDD